MGRALAAIVERARRHAVAVLLLALLAAGASLAFEVGQLGIDGDTDRLFDPDLPFQRERTAFDAAFPALEDPMLVVIDAPSAARAVDAAAALAERLRADPELFASVFAPGTGEFFERNGLLYLGLDELDDLASDLARAQPFLAELARDPSLRGLFGLLEAAQRRARFGIGADLPRVLNTVADALGTGERIQGAPRTIGDLVLSEGEPLAGARRYVIATPRVDFGSFVPGERSITRLREHFAELGWTDGGPVRARITGEPALQAEELGVLRRQAAAAGVASFATVALILALALRSGRLIAAVLVTLLVGLAWTAGFAALAVGHLNLISVAFAVLFIGLGVDFGIHYALRYQELRAGGLAHAASLAGSAASVGSALLLCALTTAVGFFAFVPTGYRGVAELGIISGAGMLLSLVASLTVLPAAISVGQRLWHRPLPDGRAGAFTLPSLPARHPRLVAAITAVAALGAALLAGRWHFDANPLRVRDPSTESVRTFLELLDDGDVNPWSIDVLAPSLAQAEALAGRIRALESVERADTLHAYVPDDQKAKLEILSDVSLFLAPALEAVPSPPPSAAEELASLASFRDFLAQEPAEDPALAAAGARLGAALDAFLADPDAAAVLPQLRVALVGSVLDHLDRLRRALSAAPVALGELPDELRARMLTEDGRARIEVFPKESLRDDAALAHFVQQVRGVAPRATGTSVVMFESARVIVQALREAFTLAAAAMAVILLLLWRRPVSVLLALAPLCLAALFTAALAVLVGIPLNFADVIVLPLLLGIGVDSGIHLVQRHRGEGTPAHALLATSTSRAVLWSALTTTASFGSLAFATHRGMATLGQLLTLGVAVTLLCNLLVLPALLALSERWTAPPGGRAARERGSSAGPDPGRT